MLTIRFSRKGKKKQPIYRVIVSEKTRDPWGKYLEGLGFYDPKTKEAQLNKERIEFWISKGAQPTPTVHNLLVTKEIMKEEKVRASKSKPGKKRQLELDRIAKEKADAEAKVKADAEAAAQAAAAPAEEAAPVEEIAKTEEATEVAGQESAQ